MISRMSSNQIHMGSLEVILDAQAKLQRTQEEMASGKRLLKPSDDPVATAQIMQIRTELSRIETLQTNINSVSRELAMVETNLSGIENILMRARELAVRGSNDSLSSQDKALIATEIDALREQLISMANTKGTNGEYIYSGNAVNTAPYTDDAVTPVYGGDDELRAVNIAPGLTLESRVTGTEVFGEGTEATGELNAFEALSVLSAGLRGVAGEAITDLSHDGTDVTEDNATALAMSALDANLESLASVRTEIGVRMNRVDDQRSINDAFNIKLQETLSGLEDLDYSKAITEMNLQMVALEAAQKAYTTTQNLSLFNYL